MAYKNLHHFIEVLEHEGELIRIQDTISTCLEITEICDRMSKSKDGGLALLFENVYNHNNQKKSSQPVLINALGSKRRMNLALHVEKIDEVADEIRALIKQQPPTTFLEKIKMLPTLVQIASFAPKKVSEGSCQEIVIQGDAINLNDFPILKCWPKDGGSFITFGGTISKDPDTGIRNVGMYRVQIKDKNKAAMHWQIHKHGSRHFQRYQELGQKIPVAIFLGGDPAITFSAACPLPDNFDEFLFAGFLRKKSVELVKCKTNDLEVPASSEMIIEGYVDPNLPLIPEGPFGDHTGYYTPIDLYPALHVTAITYR